MLVSAMAAPTARVRSVVGGSVIVVTTASHKSEGGRRGARMSSTVPGRGRACSSRAARRSFGSLFVPVRFAVVVILVRHGFAVVAVLISTIAAGAVARAVAIVVVAAAAVAGVFLVVFRLRFPVTVEVVAPDAARRWTGAQACRHRRARHGLVEAQVEQLSGRQHVLLPGSALARARTAINDAARFVSRHAIALRPPTGHDGHFYPAVGFRGHARSGAPRGARALVLIRRWPRRSNVHLAVGARALAVQPLVETLLVEVVPARQFTDLVLVLKLDEADGALGAERQLHALFVGRQLDVFVVADFVVAHSLRLHLPPLFHHHPAATDERDRQRAAQDQRERRHGYDHAHEGMRHRGVGGVREVDRPVRGAGCRVSVGHHARRRHRVPLPQRALTTLGGIEGGAVAKQHVRIDRRVSRREHFAAVGAGVVVPIRTVVVREVIIRVEAAHFESGAAVLVQAASGAVFGVLRRLEQTVVGVHPVLLVVSRPGARAVAVALELPQERVAGDDVIVASLRRRGCAIRVRRAEAHTVAVHVRVSLQAGAAAGAHPT
mmetsp:Transcript_44326/g.65236  ORF Transcript_44326/g.65236 Transcript_44326/m.65236 type:complete len:549 (-) Transcript_44326:431-2077(-)